MTNIFLGNFPQVYIVAVNVFFRFCCYYWRVILSVQPFFFSMCVCVLMTLMGPKSEPPEEAKLTGVCVCVVGNQSCNQSIK